ncbi:MarR family winged helix-turn-helix transcriptional regulator [Corynebacterium freneyi]|uniref:MarR family winged helix-turn-helix transcriptional regulator n=1 Tax=Corynebacterium freneyi TaxID=134034 RepID=UPI00068A8A4B|nr:MarR family winged helix-turn-helix transcriptional regulator [Corynebacterium freneyi]
MTTTRRRSSRGAVIDDSSAGQSDSVLTLLVHTSKVLSQLASERVGEFGFSLDEWMVLDAIAKRSGSSMTRISEATGCYGASLTRAVDKLVTSACVYREVSQADRRRVEVFLADAGREKHAEISAALTDLESFLDQVLHTAEIERTVLLGIFNDMRRINPS